MGNGVLVDLTSNSAVYAGGLSTLYNIENVTGGNGGDYLIGDYKNNIFIGGGGIDTLEGNSEFATHNYIKDIALAALIFCNRALFRYYAASCL